MVPAGQEQCDMETPPSKKNLCPYFWRAVL